ncbi:hypothetical protein LOD99_4696 [Oopsacas minuta]|uniref:Peptidase C19 ubiquitin carboxyl-terminal hydrolase domain-containing protein n=1 Tax=Oopsacas minuta TaxID=111878 RepID=A0AAV7JVW2_9METZ|nr:hypothetical protein LOD99_4696 [Oopsacas minuta]
MDTSYVSETDTRSSDPPRALFLTSIIQLLWETDAFRKRFRTVKHHSNCKYTSCFFCALKSIFPNFQHHKYPGLPPNIVQRAATILQSDSAVSFDSASLALSSLLSSLNTCLSTPLGQELFGVEIDEVLACECGYKAKTNSVLKYFLSISVEMFYLQANAMRQTERLNTQIDPRYFTRILRELNLSLLTLSCPNNTNCSRLIKPSLQLINSPPLLAFEIAWDRGEVDVSDKLDTLLNSLATSLSLEDLLTSSQQYGDKKRYELTAMLCLFESSEVLFTFHSANLSWVRIDLESVKLADGTFPQLLFYMKQNLYLPILLLYSDPDYILPRSSVLVLSQPQLSSSSEESRSHLSNAWRDEEQNTSHWKEGNSSYLQHITDSLQNHTALTDDTHSYGYLDFGLAASEPHAGIINLNNSSPSILRSDGSFKDQHENFQPTKVYVHSPYTEKRTIYPNEGEVMSSCSDSLSLSPNPAPLRAPSKRKTCQKHVPSIPTPFALLWELEVFRKSLQRVQGHVCTLKTCVFCVYQLILDRFDYKDIPVVPPELLRRVMAICFEKQEGYNLGLSFDGIHKTYEELLVRIHYNLTGSGEVTSCSAPHCLTHQKFSSNFILHGNCQCGHSLELSHSLELVYSISAQSLIEESRKISNSSKSSRSNSREFETILKLIGSLQDTQPCPNPNCKAPLRIQRTLTNKPDVFTISLNWDGLPITSQCLHDVINSIGTSLYLDDIFDHTQPFLKFRPFYLTAIVARNDPKYAFFFNHSTLHAWYCLDDAKITTLGDKWGSVNNALHSIPYQAILLVYIDPLFSQLQTDSALTESVLSPGAEGEKIGREFLFPRTPDSVSSCNNVHGSPESMYSSDAELFQWRAGERISYPATNSGKILFDKLHSAGQDSDNELDSSLVIHEELGTFRIVEGADGEKRALIDLISPTSDIPATEDNLTTPPALLLLWQLDVFRNIITGITKHQCEGESCIVCALKTVQYSTDPNLTPEALNTILSHKSLLQRMGQGPQSFFQDVLTRLHNCLCTENYFTGDYNISEMCCSSLCIAHQKLSLRLEISERGRNSENNDLFLLELSAPELIRSIRSLNKETSTAAGSIRVMQLFTQATRSLLEQSVGNNKRTFSLLNDPEIICLSLTWDGEPSRDEVTEFYELISTAIQPADLFHHTHNKYIAKRMYYLVGIVTQGPSSSETWFYHQKYRSWTHFSGRTLAVSQLGPQLSLVWHSCKASTNTYAPIFLLYSNPSVNPHSQESTSPLATAPKHPSQYNTLTPSKPLFHEDFVVISSERNRVSPFSVQQGVDEALSFLDATIKYEEMNLTPSPVSVHRNPVVSVKSSSLERSGTLDSEILSVISDNDVQASSHSPLLSSLSDHPFSTSIFSPISFEVC